ncbi:MAG: ABC transporter ATP-binding protein, partial [Lachnospiraceae bacterium]|nr:ABC transporter ATP-binding protein [Lachnospiraceae bacterium]
MEENKTVQLPWYGIPAVAPFLKPYRKRVVVMVFLGILSSVIDSCYPLFNRYILNHMVPEKDTHLMPFLIVFYVAVLLFQVWDNYYTVYACGKVEMQVNRDLRNASFGHLQTLSFSYFNQNNVGYIHARVMSDSGKIGELVSWRMMDIVWAGSYVLSVVMVMLFTNLRLAFCVLALVPVAIVVVILFQKKLVVLNRKIREINSRITGDINEGITGVRSIKTLVAEDKMNGDFL